MKRKPEKRDWLNIILILILVGLFIWIGTNYVKTFGEVNTGDLLSSAKNLQQFILSYGNAGLLVMVFFHMLHVILSFIPSVIVQFVGGLIFGMPAGMITGIIGIAIGTAVSFYLSRFLGRRVVTLFVSEKNISKLEGLLSSNTSAIVLLLLFILPTPKDFFAYFIGLTNMKASKFFLISAIGRLPGMIVATYLGAHVFDRNYVLLISIVVASSILCLLLVIFKDKILGFATKRNNVKL